MKDNSVALQNKVRVLIVGGQPVFRRGLAVILRADHRMDVVGEARDGYQAIGQTVTLQPDVVLLDVDLPGLDGVRVTRYLGKALPDVRVVAFDTDPTAARGALAAGARAFVGKDVSIEELPDVVHRAALGERPSHVDELSEALPSGHAEPLLTPRLTDRETLILELVCRSRSNRQISAALGLRVSTVNTHLLRLRSKLGARTRTQLIVQAVQLGLVPAHPADRP